MVPPQAIAISVVVPVGPADMSWRELLPLLAPQLGPDHELVVAATVPPPPEFVALCPTGVSLNRWRWLEGVPGRGRQQNLGASAALGRFLWFLHADSRPTAGALDRLHGCLGSDTAAVWYFDLHFLPDGLRLMWLNTAGARLRSRLGGLPFGDQGLALARDRFEALGRFREDAAYGEDHLLVWAARRAGMRLRAVGLPLATSARRYRERGWLGTTLIHLWRTGRQALPEWVAWLRGR